MKRLLLLSVFIYFCVLPAFSQIRLGSGSSSKSVDINNPKEYEIGGITVSGAQFLDNAALINLSGLSVGDKIKVPGEEIAQAIQRLWKQDLFGDIQVEASKIEGNLIFINLVLKERPRLSKFNFIGIRKGESDDLKEKLKLVKGKVVNENLLNTSKYGIVNFYKEKGYFNVKVEIQEIPDTTLSNSATLKFFIKKGKKVKIERLIIDGNSGVADKKIKKWFKETKEYQAWNIFRTSKFIKKKFEEDKALVIEKYNNLGYRDAKILSDSLVMLNEKRIAIVVRLKEGQKYYFGNIEFSGNTKYSSDVLNRILGIKKGDVYDRSLMSARLSGSTNGSDISSLYLDDGYLFFRVDPVEKAVVKDTIDIEIRIYEGAQATINKIIVKGNEKTNDKVIYREIRTKPGQKFSRSEIIRTQRELLTLGYFDPEKFNVTPKPNPANGTVDIEYFVSEKPSDQISLSGGYGGNRVVGTLQLTFNNFSARNLFKGKEWDPIPAGDGQRISLAAQSNGLFAQSYSVSFTEPWLGGRKPNNFSVTAFKTVFTNGLAKTESNYYSLKTNGLTVGLGKRLKFPDDYFVLNSSVSLLQYRINNYPGFVFNDGDSYNFNLTETISRSSVDQPIYPQSGSLISLSFAATPPYSLLSGKDYSNLPNKEKFKLVEYYKMKFDVSWYTRLFAKVVLNAKAQFGYLGFYNDALGLTQFERFKLGGSGLNFNFNLQGAEIIGLRGYPDLSVVPNARFANSGSPIFNKFTFELRQPLTLNPTATIFVLGFIEGGNTYAQFSDFSPFNVKRSAGVGVRVFLPIFGLLGLDYGWRLDQLPVPVSEKGQFHFTLGQQF